MIIVRTPLRISFFGGGTDFPEFFSENGGAVLGTAIDKYIYHTVSHVPSWLFDHKIRFAYRKVEFANSLDEIEHTPFREILRHCDIHKDIEVNLASDLPAFSGLGSSSSFTVGLIKGLNAFSGRHINQHELAEQAIFIEREVLKEAVGVQDQIFASYGGLNIIQLSSKCNFSVERIALSRERLKELDESLMLFFTGVTRRAQEVEKKKIQNIANLNTNLKKMLMLVDRAHAALTGNGGLSAFGALLHETWMEKRSLDSAVSTPEIDALYQQGVNAGALGGKLLGAGGGGFMLFFVPPERQKQVRIALAAYNEVRFSINAPGSAIIHS
jgi:D-glycero-alpha-D-manno-heptose-7-phosphate kinase